MRPVILGSLLLLLATAAPAQSPFGDPLRIGTMDSLKSSVLNEQRRFLVYTPPSYRDTTYLPQRYPVLYLLDGDAHFHSVTGLLHILGTGINGTYVLPEMIVVAVPNTDRTRDMTPTRVERDAQGNPQPFLRTSGGMGNFLRFFETELIPHIERTYRTAPYRVLVGHSLGGITAINALYTTPAAFNAYVAIDPSLWYDDRLLLKQARDYFSKPGLDGRALYVAQANTINPSDTTANVHFNSILQFNAILEAFNGSGLRYAFKYYDNDDHGSVPLIAEYDALRFIFRDYRVDLMRSLDRPAFIAEHFARASASLGYRIQPPERMVDFLGRISLGRDTTKALEFMELNASLYPNSSNAQVSLGDVLRARGDSARAVAAYERALALRPGNQRARDMIQQIKGGGR